MHETGNHLVLTFEFNLRNLKGHERGTDTWRLMKKHLIEVMEDCYRRTYVEPMALSLMEKCRELDETGTFSFYYGKSSAIVFRWLQESVTEYEVYATKESVAEHRDMHEVMHLLNVLRARKRGERRSMIWNNFVMLDFYSRNGIVEGTECPTGPGAAKYVLGCGAKHARTLTHGILDMFVEDTLFNAFRRLRPLQLLSLLREYDMKNGKAIRGDRMTVVRLLEKMYLEERFGVEIADEYHFADGTEPSKEEKEKARNLFDAFLKCRGEDGYTARFELLEKAVEAVGMGDVLKLVNDKELTQERTDFSERVIYGSKSQKQHDKQTHLRVLEKDE